MRLALLLSGAAMLAAIPAAAQDHSGHAGMEHSQHPMPAQPSAAAVDHSMMDHSQHQTPAEPEPAPVDHSAMDHSQHRMPAQPGAAAVDHSTMDHSQHQMPAAATAGPPARAFEGPTHAADAIFDPAAMAAARAANHREHGAMKTGTLLAERLEARVQDGADAYLWDVQGWYGGDIDRLTVKTEGEGAFRGGVDDAEVQALWSHAISPWFDLQAGVRLDVEPDVRSHLALGVQGLAPYMIHLDAAAFVSDKGDVTARIEAEHDWKLTQRLILQPRAELELAAQDIPERGIGAGLAEVGAGLRLRYEIVREFAPYVGVEYQAKLGETARLARAEGEDPRGVVFVLGLRTWF